MRGILGERLELVLTRAYIPQIGTDFLLCALNLPGLLSQLAENGLGLLDEIVAVTILVHLTIGLL